mgnify:CR=1 FL=1
MVRALLQAARTAGKDLLSTTVRDFSGGLNVADNELTLSPRFNPILDNFNRAQDGSLEVRQGTRRFAKTSVPDDATAYTFGSVSATIQTFVGNANVTIVVGASSPIKFNIGQLVRISGVVTTYGGITPANINGVKAFYEIERILLTDGPDTDFDVGWGNVFGMPFATVSLVATFFDENEQATPATVVNADLTDPQTATSGDPRGTFDPASNPNGTSPIKIMGHAYRDLNANGNGGLHGLAHFRT